MGGFGPTSRVCSSGEVPEVTTPMQSRCLHPNQELPVNKRFTPRSASCLRAFVLSGLASFLADAQGRMINHVSLKVLGILVLSTVIKVDICGPELAGGTYSMQGEKCGVENQLLGGQNKAGSYLQFLVPHQPQFAERLAACKDAGVHAVLTSTASRRNISSWDAKLIQRHSKHMG